MHLFRNIIFIFFILQLCFSALHAQQVRMNLIPKKDTVNIYNEMLNDRSDDLMENHPADDIYSNIWTPNRLNPYKIPIDSLPDSVKIDCRKFTIPIKGRVTSSFGPRRYRYHYGTDLSVKIGDSIMSAFSGRVRIIDYEARGYGHYVVIRHENGLESVYAHLSKVLVQLDQNVRSGELIALAGNTGRSTGPHLHFETRYLGNAINPATIIDFNTGLAHDDTYIITKTKSFHYQRAAEQAKSQKSQTAVRYYAVKKGDNLGSIAMRNGTSIKNLCRLNGIKENKLLQLGQKLRVR